MTRFRFECFLEEAISIYYIDEVTLCFFLVLYFQLEFYFVCMAFFPMIYPTRSPMFVYWYKFLHSLHIIAILHINGSSRIEF